MSIQHANRGISKKDLSVYYDREWSKSFRGEPTTNLVFGDYDSFENAVNTNYYPAGLTATRSTDYAYFGTYSLRISRTTSAGDSFADMESYIQVLPSTTYTYSCYIYTTALVFSIDVLRPTFFSSAGVYVGEGVGGTITSADIGKWKRVSYTFTTPSNCTQLVARLNIAGNASYFPTTYYADGRQLEQKGYATPFVRSYQLQNNDIVPRREKDINWFKAYGTSGAGAAADNNVTFAINGNGTFVRLGYGQTFGDYTIKQSDVVYKYTLGTNGCHFHGNAIYMRAGEYGIFTCDYFISSDAVNPGTGGNDGTLLVTENYGGNAPSGGYGVSVPDLTKGVWRTATLFVGPAGAGGGTVAMFLYPGACGGRFATSGYLLMKNPTFTINTLKKPVTFKYPGVSFTPNLTNVTQAAYGDSRFTKSGATSWNNARIYSTEGYTTPCYISFYPNQNNLGLMIALNSDPGSGIDYSYLDYAWYTDSTGQAYIFENGSSVLTAGAYTSATLFEIIYDGTNVNYYMAGVLRRSVRRTATTALYLDSSFYTDGAQVYNLAFGPYVSGMLSDNAGLLDISGTGNNTGFANMSYNSDGFTFTAANSNYFNTGISTLPSNTQLTIDVWTKPASTTQQTTLVSKWGSSSQFNFSFLLFLNWFAQGNIYFLVGSANGDGYSIHSIPHNLSTSSFINYTIVYNNGLVSWYRNGVFIQTDTNGNAPLRSITTPITIGADYDTGSIDIAGRFYDGSIPNVKLYSRSLTADEVLQNFNSQRKTYAL